MAKAKKRSGTTARRRTVVKVVGKRRTHHAPPKKRKRRISGVSGVGAVGRTKTGTRRKTKKRGFLGSTHGNNLKSIGVMAVGVAVGAGITHIILRPVEKKLTEKWPMIGKFIAAGEVFLGGVIALKGKSNFTKSLGVGILAGGVHGLMKQANIYKHIPGISGPGDDDYTTVKIPINGMEDVQRMVAGVGGILNDGRRNIRTDTVAGLGSAAIHDRVGGMPRTAWLAGDDERETVLSFPVKGGW